MASSCGWPVGLSGRHALSDVWYMIAVMGSLAFFNRIRFRIFLKLRSGSYITTTFNLFSKLWKAWATSLYMKNSLAPVTRNVNFFWIFCISDYNGRCFNKLRVSRLVEPSPPPPCEMRSLEEEFYYQPKDWNKICFFKMLRLFVLMPSIHDKLVWFLLTFYQ